MTAEELHNRIIERWQAGASARLIARELGVSRSTVRNVLLEFQAGRNGEQRQRRFSRPSKLDAWLPTISSLLARYPNITAARVYEELRAQGFSGRYTIVRERLRQLRPTAHPPVVRFETGPGVQAQMDYSTYTLDFTAAGRRRVHLFGYVLGYSRRQYLRFVEHQDFETTVREHIRAFEHLGGVAATCLYDNMKVVVSGFDGHEPIYNPRFLAFATHYGFKPWACRPRRARTKGKIERPFSYVEQSLLNGRTFQSLAHLNDVTRWWLENVSDIHVHRTTNQRPLDRHAEELPYLIPLPARAFDPSPVVYRVVDAEGFVAWRSNRYSVPWRYIGQMLPVRISENEVIVYSPQVEEMARHPLLAAGTSGQQSVQAEHPPRRDGAERLEMLRERFAQLGEMATRFLDGLLASRRNGKDEAQKVLALLGTYAQVDLLRALARAVRYRAFSLRVWNAFWPSLPSPRACWRPWPTRPASVWLNCTLTRQSLRAPLLITSLCLRNPLMAKAHPSKNNHAKSNQAKISPAQAIPAVKHPAKDLRQQVLEDFAVLRVPLDEQSFDEYLSRAEQEGLTPLEFLARLVGEQANHRRERAMERRIKDARFPDVCTLAEFDWQFNAQTIDGPWADRATRRLRLPPP